MIISKGHRLKLVGVAIVALVVVALFVFIPGLGKERALGWIKDMSTAAFVAAFVFLPLVGMPISIFLIMAGLKFGVAKGLVVAAGCMLFHNVVAYWLTHSFLKKPITRFMGRTGYEIPDVPERHQVWFTAAFTGIPGIPYAPKLYLLALTNIPFRIYVGVGWPIYSLCNIVYIGLAGAAVDIDWRWVVLLIVIGIAMVAMCFWLKKRLEVRLRNMGDDRN